MKRQCLLIVLTLIFGLISCDKGDDGGSPISRSHRNQGGAGPNDGFDSRNGFQDRFNGESLIGIIFDSDLNEFQQQVENFMSAAIDPMGMGTVSGRSDDSTGVVFWGYMPLSSGVGIDPGRMDGEEIRPGSEMDLVVWDSFSDVDGHYQVPFEVVDSVFDGSRIRILLEDLDGYGSVELDGDADCRVFSGVVHYENYEHFSGGQPAGPGTLGRFEIPTCGFFECDQSCN